MLQEDIELRGAQGSILGLQEIITAGQHMLGIINTRLDPALMKKWQTGMKRLLDELPAPLSTVIASAQRMEQDAREQNQENSVPDLQKIRLAAERLLALVDEGLSFSDFDGTDSVPGLGPALLTTAAGDPEEDALPLEEAAPLREMDSRFLLVVDDNGENRDMLSRRLRRQGRRVLVARGGRQALEMIGANSFDLVLLDIMMPEVSGYQVLEKLKADEKSRHIPMIVLFALDEMDGVVRYIELGAEDYLPKPFNSVLLRARIGACLEKKRLEHRSAIIFKSNSGRPRRWKAWAA